MKIMSVLALKKNRGLTLVEVVIFVAIFSTALVLLLSSVVYSSFVFSNSQNKLLAAHKGEQVAEWLLYQRDSHSFATFLTKAPPHDTPIPTTLYSCPNTPTPLVPTLGVTSTPPPPTATPCPIYTTPVPTQSFFRSENTYCLNDDYLNQDVSDLSPGYCPGYTDNFKKEMVMVTNEAKDSIEVYVRIYWRERLKTKYIEIQQLLNKYDD